MLYPDTSVWLWWLARWVFVHQGLIRVLNLGFGFKTKPFPFSTWRNLKPHTPVFTLPLVVDVTKGWVAFSEVQRSVTQFTKIGHIPNLDEEILDFCRLFLLEHGGVTRDLSLARAQSERISPDALCPSYRNTSYIEIFPWVGCSLLALKATWCFYRMGTWICEDWEKKSRCFAPRETGKKKSGEKKKSRCFAPRSTGKKKKSGDKKKSGCFTPRETRKNKSTAQKSGWSPDFVRAEIHSPPLSLTPSPPFSFP